MDGRRAEFMAFTSSLAISLSCLLVVSLALQILIHFFRVSLLSANNFFLVLFSRIPRTTRSLSKLSAQVFCSDEELTLEMSAFYQTSRLFIKPNI